MKQELNNGWVIYIPQFLSNEQAIALYQHCYQLPLQQNKIKLFGKEVLIPRKELMMANEGLSYAYSGKSMMIHPFSDEIMAIKSKIENASETTFNSVLINLYRDGQDSNGWHADNEKELGQNPIIASLSLGETRRFDIKHNQTKEKNSFQLHSGDLLIMGGEMQHYWKHQIAKTKKRVEPRINLTFRKLN